MPTRLDRQPLTLVQGPQIDPVADIPSAVNMIVRHAVARRGIVVTVDILQDAVGIVLVDKRGAHVEEALHLIPVNEPVRLVRRGGPGLVHERAENVAGMGADMALHPSRLPGGLGDLVPADRREER